MNHESMLLTAILVPTVGAFALPLVGRMSPRLRNVLAAAMVLASLVVSLALAPAVLAGQIINVSYELPLGLNFSFTADALAVFVAIASSLVSTIIVVYSWGYIAHYPNQNEYYCMVVLFLGAMMGLVFSANLIWLYVFWEITGIVSWRLIGFFRERYQVVRADKAFLVTIFGAVLMLLGFLAIHQQTGSFDLAVIKQHMVGAKLSGGVMLLILAGILSKSATLPFHTWLPDAGVAPSPVTALLHAAVLVKIGVYVFARLFVATMGIEPDWRVIVAGVAAASALVSAGAALIDTDLKRIIAFSTISQIGFIFLGLATGTSIGVAGAVLFILTHGLAKGGLFLCAGIIEHGTHTKDITALGGLIRKMPVTAIAFLLCAFSVMGLPPFGGFFSKYMVIAGAAQGLPLWVSCTFVAGAVLTIIYLFRVFNMVFLGEERTRAEREGVPVMVYSVATLAVLSLLTGIFINPSTDFVRKAVENLPGIVK